MSHDPPFEIDGVNLKDPLRQIEPNARDRARISNRHAHASDQGRKA